MTPHTLRPEETAERQDHQREPGRRLRLRAGSLLGVILATAVAGSLLVVPASGAGAQNQDGPAEEPTTEDTTTEDTVEEEPTTEDTTTEDTVEEEPTTEDTVEEEPTTEDTTTEDTVEEEPTTAGGQPSEQPEPGEPTAGECAQPPPSHDETDVAGWSVACSDTGYWVVELTCGEAYTHAGRTVRFTTMAGGATQPSLYDLCGYVECPAVASATTEGLPGAGDGDEEPGPATVDGTDPEPGGDEAADIEPDDEDAADDLEPGGDGGDSEPGDDAADPESTTAGRASDENRCGAPWPPGTWHETAYTDPITGAQDADVRLSGKWLGVRHHRASAVPSLAIGCAAGGLTLGLHTGGDIAAAYGHGVPVEYRIGDTVRFEEWVELPTSPDRDAGVSLPRWLTGEFVTLLRNNVGAEFVIRVFGYDGTPVGTAAFDLGGIEQPAESVLGLCGV